MRNKILIVDDVDINREILRSILEDEYTILEAENGKQALEIVDQEAKNMAAILLDLVMPEMDGTQVLEELNRREVMERFRFWLSVEIIRWRYRRSALSLEFPILLRSHLTMRLLSRELKIQLNFLIIN